MAGLDLFPESVDGRPHQIPDEIAYLYAMVLLVAHVDEAEGVGGDAPGIIEATVSGALRAEGPEETTGRVEHLDPVVVTIRDDVLADPVYGHPGEAVELTLAAPVCSELLHEVPVTVEYLRGERERERTPSYVGGKRAERGRFHRSRDIKIGPRPRAITSWNFLRDPVPSPFRAAQRARLIYDRRYRTRALVPKARGATVVVRPRMCFRFTRAPGLTIIASNDPRLIYRDVPR